MTKIEQEKRQPWMKFYPADWQADEGLGQCSLAARGLWVELLAIMHKSPVIGHLLIAGKQPTHAQIAIQVKSDAKSVAKAMKELEVWGVFSLTEDGVIYSRRMVSDHEKAERDRLNGKGGGNPKLKTKQVLDVNGGVNPKVNLNHNPEVNGVDKAQKLEARSQKEKVVALGTDGDLRPGAELLPSDPFPRYPNPPGNPPMPLRGDPPDAWKHLGKIEPDFQGVPRAQRGGYFVDDAAEMICEAAKIREERWRGDWRPMLEWLDAGLDLHDAILPAIRQVAARSGYKPPGTLKYFDAAIRQVAGGAR